MRLINCPKSMRECGESQIGVLLGAMVIGVLIYIAFSFMGWWKTMKDSRMDKTQTFINSQIPKTEYKKLHIRKGYKMSFTKESRR